MYNPTKRRKIIVEKRTNIRKKSKKRAKTRIEKPVVDLQDLTMEIVFGESGFKTGLARKNQIPITEAIHDRLADFEDETQLLFELGKEYIDLHYRNDPKGLMYLDNLFRTYGGYDVVNGLFIKTLKDERFRFPDYAYADNIINTFTKYGANDIRFQDIDDKNLLHYAVFEFDGYTDFIKLLIKSGANVNKLDQRNNTPFHILLQEAQEDGVDEKLEPDFLEIVRLMKHAGANIDLQNNRGETVRSIALGLEGFDSEGNAFWQEVRNILFSENDN